MKRILSAAIVLASLLTTALAGDRYAITMGDGSVAIMQVIEGTPQEAIAEWPKERQEQVVSVEAIDTADLPQDRTFRDAWTFADGKFEIDMEKARDVARQAFIQAEVAAHEKAGRTALVAEIVGDDTAKAAAEARLEVRKTLPEAEISAAKTPDELKSIWPDSLQLETEQEQAIR